MSDFNGDFAARCEPAGLGCLVLEAIDGKPLTNAFNADLGGGLEFPATRGRFAKALRRSLAKPAPSWRSWSWSSYRSRCGLRRENG